MVIGNGNGPAAAARGDEKALAFSRGRLLTAHRGTYYVVSVTTLAAAEARQACACGLQISLSPVDVSPAPSPRFARGGPGRGRRREATMYTQVPL